jgi:hypothetical protein
MLTRQAEKARQHQEKKAAETALQQKLEQTSLKHQEKKKKQDGEHKQEEEQQKQAEVEKRKADKAAAAAALVVSPCFKWNSTRWTHQSMPISLIWCKGVQRMRWQRMRRNSACPSNPSRRHPL